MTVCLPAKAGADLADAMDSALAPFGASTELDWDFGFLWDTWHVEGASDGYGLWVREGCEDDPRLIHDNPHWQTGSRLSLPGMCAGGPRELLDLTESPALGRALAVEAWQLWHRLAQHNPPALPHASILRRIQPDPHRYVDFDRVEAEYGAQPLVQAYRAAHPLGGRDPERYCAKPQFFPGDPAFVGLDAESFADRVVSRRLGGWNLLTLDGWWIEADGAAHHGTCGTACPHRPDNYDTARGDANFATGMYRYLDALPPDTLLVRIHGHC